MYPRHHPFTLNFHLPSYPISVHLPSISIYLRYLGDRKPPPELIAKQISLRRSQRKHHGNDAIETYSSLNERGATVDEAINVAKKHSSTHTNSEPASGGVAAASIPRPPNPGASAAFAAMGSTVLITRKEASKIMDAGKKNDKKFSAQEVDPAYQIIFPGQSQAVTPLPFDIIAIFADEDLPINFQMSSVMNGKAQPNLKGNVFPWEERAKFDGCPSYGKMIIFPNLRLFPFNPSSLNLSVFSFPTTRFVPRGTPQGNVWVISIVARYSPIRWIWAV